MLPYGNCINVLASSLRYERVGGAGCCDDFSRCVRIKRAKTRPYPIGTPVAYNQPGQTSSRCVYGKRYQRCRVFTGFAEPVPKCFANDGIRNTDRGVSVRTIHLRMDIVWDFPDMARARTHFGVRARAGRRVLLREEVQDHPVPLIGVADIDAVGGTCDDVQLRPGDRRVRARSRAFEWHDPVAGAMND